jgi:flavin-dependent dehydrogenase
VARYLGNKGSPAPVLAQEIEFEMDAPEAGHSPVAGEVPELFFCRDMLGYGWAFRKDNYLNVGLGRTGPGEISRHVKDFVAYLAETRAVEVPPSGIAGHAYGLIGRSRRKILDDGVLLIGDAAGLAYPESGEGIRPAIESGLMAAHVIVSAQGDYSARKLAPYRQLLHARFEREPTRLDAVARLLPAIIKAAAARGLLRSRSFCGNVVMNQWFLRVAEERLALGPPRVQAQLTSS